ncbi:MAG: Trm112 family protein [Candidatus Nitrosopolaris sp.]
MRKSMLDILACPIDKYYPLELFELDVRLQKSDKDTVISEGILFCGKCFRFFPIVDEIPIMLPDELRERQSEIEFLQKWRNEIPDKVIRYGNPWHL